MEAYELTTQGGATDFAPLIAACESFGPYCLIGGLAVNCYVEPVYTLDADVVVPADINKHWLKASAPGSQLRIRFTTDERYQAYPARSVDADVLGIRVKVACREDVTQGKLWAYSDPQRRLSKRKKDELDLIRRVLSRAEISLSQRTPRTTGPRVETQARRSFCSVPKR